MAAFHGPLVSDYYARNILADQFAGELGEGGRGQARSALRGWWRGEGRALGPVSGCRSVFDFAAMPIARLLGFRTSAPRPVGPGWLAAALRGSSDGGEPPLLLLVTGWGEDLSSSWRQAVREALSSTAEWCLCMNGRAVRLVDTRRTFARRFLEFDIPALLEDDEGFALFWSLLRREAFEGVAPGPASVGARLVERVTLASAAQTLGVCRSLRSGVLEAVGALVDNLLPGRRSAYREGMLSGLHEQALTLVYRLLFLLFAESRNLVPTWHPTYRRSYSMEAARALAEQEGPARGLWETLQAISRLAHAGCHAGTLRVTPFNGRLFAPSLTPAGEHGRPGDDCARRVMLSLTTTPGRGGASRSRIVYSDLGVEQLGSVYESLLDYRAVLADGTGGTPGTGETPVLLNADGTGGTPVLLVRGSGLRKATGTFYTPSSITNYLVRRALRPLVHGATPERILELRILDPAMGSGAFLVSACRYLAGAYEEAVVRSGGCHQSDIGEEDRRTFRRSIAGRCLYGVDLNPMAVQLARLSLWLATLAPDRPLTFLDHRLLAGNSLIGASLDDIARKPCPGGRTATPYAAAAATLPLFDGSEAARALRAVLPCRLQLAADPEDDVSCVREKEQILASISGPTSGLGRWKAVADAWCGLTLAGKGAAHAPGLFTSLADVILTGRSALPGATARECLERLSKLAAAHRFFHWSLEFPELFFDSEGRPRADAGFDVVLGNPPWDMMRADNDDRHDAAGTREAAAALRDFARGSGVYRASGAGHQNKYQLFVERALRLTKPNGRIGMVVPSGLSSDCGSSSLRRLLLDGCQLDAMLTFENSNRVFPIHRSFRFLVFTGTVGPPTETLAMRTGVRDAAELDSIPDAGRSSNFPIAFSRRLLERISGDELAIPDVRSPEDVALLEKLSSSAALLGAPEGWGARFGRELNATEDKALFGAGGAGLPVLEGKHLHPFQLRIPDGVPRLRAGVEQSVPQGRASWKTRRLGYRDVASVTNRLTLIAAMVPGNAVTVHTVFCLKTPMREDDQLFLCGVLNSFVANFLVRMRVTTHVTTGIVSRLPVPRPAAGSPQLSEITRLARELECRERPEESREYVLLQAEVARLYGLSSDELSHVLETFPLISKGTRNATLQAFLSPTE